MIRTIICMWIFRDVCVTVLRQYISITNLQEATILVFYSFQSGPHVSGDTFALPQEHLTVFAAFDIKHQRSCRPVTWVRWNLSVLPVGRNVGIYQKLQIQLIAPKDGRKYRPKHILLIGKINKPKLLNLFFLFILLNISYLLKTQKRFL
jgi:hypothetical protein